MSQVKRLRELDELDPKLGPQEALVFELITEEAQTYASLTDQLSEELTNGGYEGAQSPEAMLRYYISSLQKRRLIHATGVTRGGTNTALNSMFTRLREVDELDTRLSPREVILFGLIPMEGIPRADLLEKIGEMIAEGDIETKQDASQMISLYSKDLANRRLISIK